MEPGDLDDLYGKNVLEHCRNPRNHDKLEHPDATARAVNPFCGDEVELQIILDGDRVSQIGVQGVGCCINQATSSMLSEAVKGRSLGEVEALSELFRRMMQDAALSDDEVQQLGELRAMAGVLQYPVRIKCALLSWTALEGAVKDCLQGRAG
jgi:nitrogen fixation NifU-like protein